MVDPIESLPFETIVQIFRQLSTPDVAISASTSRNWRNKLLSDPDINKVIDMSKLTESLEQDELIDLVHRLLSNSTHESRQVSRELHLSIDSFWYDFSSSKDDSDLEDDNFFILFDVISSAAQGKLGKIFLITDPDLSTWEGHTLNHVGNAILRAALILKTPTLKQVHFSVPFPLSVETSSASDLIFSVQRKVDENVDPALEYDVDSCRTFLEGIFDLTGGRIKSLKLDLLPCLGIEADNEQDGPRTLYQELSKSSSTMEKLEMRVDGNAAGQIFELVAGFSNLSHLELEIPNSREDDGDLGGITFISAPKRLPSFRLVYFGLDTCWKRELESVDWLVDCDWRDLKTFSLSLNPFGPGLAARTLLSILDVASSLETLDLSGVSISGILAFTSKQHLPNLKLLGLGNLTLTGYEIFTAFSMPVLEDFTFDYLSPTEHRAVLKEGEELSATKHFSTILEGCRSSLVELRVYNGPEELETDQKELEMSRLEILRVLDSNELTTIFLSHFKAPRMKKLIINTASIHPQSLLSLMLCGDASLEEIGISGLTAEISQETYSDVRSGGKLHLPKLRTLMIGDNDDHLLHLMSLVLSPIPSEEKLKLDVNGQALTENLISFLRSMDSSITNLVIRNESANLEIDSGGVNFPNATKSDLNLKTLSSLEFFLVQCSYQGLSSLSLVHTAALPLLQVSRFIKSHSKSLTKLIVKVLDLYEEDTALVAQNQEQSLFPNLTYLCCNQYGSSFSLLRNLLSLKQSGPEIEAMEANEALTVIDEKLVQIAPKLKCWRIAGAVWCHVRGDETRWR